MNVRKGVRIKETGRKRLRKRASRVKPGGDNEGGEEKKPKKNEEKQQASYYSHDGRGGERTE